MKLVEVLVQNFRSVEDSNPFRVDDLTCLVGKNEAGKTALLHALQGIKPLGDPQSDFDVDQNYPRRFVTKYDDRHDGDDALIVRTRWKLSEAARNALVAEFGADSVTNNLLTISKYYNTTGTSWTVPLLEKTAVEYLIAKANFDAAERSALLNPLSAKQLHDTLAGLANPTAKHSALLAKIKTYRNHSCAAHAIDILDKFVPKFFYTSHYDRMNGQISLNKLSADQAKGAVANGDKIFLDFLELAGTSIEELKEATRFEELIAKCEAASNEITGEIFEYWTQNDALQVRIDFTQGHPEDPVPFNSGTVVRARVWNDLHKASVPFSERSAGFVWFFSFLVQFARMRSEAGNAIILLDEPGLTLHGKAQADLLRYIEERLLPHHQVIFSTHSPFMVPADRFSSVRVVEDVVRRDERHRPLVEGTKVSEDVLVTNRDTLFPLQGALGYDLVQSLFVGKNTLLVEGPSDILYLQALSDELKRRKRVGLDERWTLCPSGGIDKIRPFVTLFGGNHLNVAVLSDQATGDKRKIEDLRRSEILAADSFFTYADFLERAEADVEDIFSPDLFVQIVNSAYTLPTKLRLNSKKLSEALPGSTRVVKQAEAAFRLMPETVPDYDHFTPSAWLIRNPTTLEANSSDVTETLERAEAIFVAYNRLL